MLGAPLVEGAITPGRFDLAPGSIREVLARFSTYDFVEQHDIRRLLAHDYGDLALQKMTPEAALEPLAGAVGRAVAASEAVVLLGGNNAITRAGVRGISGQLDRAGLLTLDAHLDLRTLEAGLVNGNPVRALLEDGLPGRNIAQVGIQSFSNSFAYAQLAQERELRVIPIEDVHARGVEVVVSEALRELASRADAIYVDLDLDALDRASSPATAASRPGGMTPAQLRLAAKVCGRHPKVRAMDLVEVDPTRDVAEVTVMAAAACLLAFASGVLARTKERPGAGSESSG